MQRQTTEFERMLDAVPGALVGVNRAGVIRYVNRQTESLFGYDRADLVGKPVETLLPDSVRPDTLPTGMPTLPTSSLGCPEPMGEPRAWAAFRARAASTGTARSSR